RPRARAVDLAFELATEHSLEPRGRRDESVEVDPRVDPIALEQVDEILGGDVAGGARSVGATAEPRAGGVEEHDTSLERSLGVCVAGSARVVEMSAHRSSEAD